MKKNPTQSFYALILILSFAIALTAHQARAASFDGLPQCLDERGIQAKIIFDPQLNDVGLAQVLPGPAGLLGDPVIRINIPNAQRLLEGNKSAFTFMYFHECGHLQSVHRLVFGMRNDLENEMSADIWAMRELVKRGFTDQQFEETFKVFESLPSGDAAHLAGPLRASVMRATLQHFRNQK